MPLLSALEAQRAVDGRQSAQALKVRRGAARLLRDLGFAVAPEVTLPSGRRADLVALSARGEVWIVEVKSSRADLASDGKWHTYGAFCDAFYFAAPPELTALFPPEEGLIASDGYDGEFVRHAPARRLGAAVRKAMHLRVALASARRLHELDDPSPLFAVPH